MNDNTIKFYNENAKKYYEDTKNGDMKNIYGNFLENIKNGGSILDLGCGSGRDSLYFINEGYKVTSVDGSINLALEAEKLTGQRVIVSMFEELHLEEQFNGIWACASLLHVKRENIIDVINRLSLNLKDDGVFYMSFKYGENEFIDEKGRYFNNYTKETFLNMINMCNNLDVIDISVSDDVLGGRNNLKWINALLISKSGK